MTRFLDPLRTAWEQSNSPWTLFNVAIYPLGQWSLTPWTRRNTELTVPHMTVLDLVWITPWDRQTMSSVGE